MALESPQTASSCSRSGKRDDLEKKRYACVQLLHKHLLLLSYVQSEIFTVCSKVAEEKQWSFFDLSSLNVHAHVTKQLVKALNKHRPYHYLERAYVSWIEHVAPAAFRSSSQQDRYSSSKLAKLIASHLLLAAEYDKAIICLSHATQLYEGDCTSRFLLLQWLCHLGEWETAKARLSSENIAPGSSYHYEAIIKAFTFIVEFNVNANKEPIINELLLLLQREDEPDGSQDPEGKSKKAGKTFLQYQCDAVIYRFMSVAGRLPNARLDKVGDPLRNLEASFSKVHTLLKNRYRSFNDDSKPIDLQKAAADSDYFLKLCSNIAEYYETALWLGREHLETGNARECGNIVLVLFSRLVRMAAFSRLLSTFNLILDVSLLCTSHFSFDGFRCVIEALLNMPNEKAENGFGEQTPTGESVETAQASRSLILGALLPCTSSQQKDTPDDKKANHTLESHKSECVCVVCLASELSAQFRFEQDFTRMLLGNFSDKSYFCLRDRYHDVSRQTKAWSSKIRSILKLKEAKSASALKKDHCWLGIRELFLTATVRWLRNGSVDERKKEVLEEALQLCSLTPWQYCCQWLTLKQLNRTPLHFPVEFDWLAEPTNDFWIKQLSDDFAKVSLQTPKNKSRAQAGIKARLTKGTPCKSSGRKVRTPACKTTIDSLDWKTAEEDFSHFNHLFYREWRFLICTYLSHVYTWRQRDFWKAAFMFAESCMCTTRQIGRSMSSSSSSFRFNSVEEFRAAVQQLPSELSVVQLFVDADRILWLVRLCYKQLPLIVPVKLLPRDDALLKRMRELLIENDQSGKLAKTSIDSKQFWKIRRDLNNRLQAIITDVQCKWLDIFAPLLLPNVSFTDYGYNAIDEIDNNCDLSDESVKALVEAVDKLSLTEWCKLAEKLAVVENVVINARKLAGKVYRKDEAEQHRLIDVLDRKYLLLSISPELASFPFEMLPILEENQRVCRIPSLYMFHRLFSRSNQIPKCVDGQKTFYVLDPGGDLTDTQNRLSKMLQQHVFWKGIIGQPPKPDELRQYLQNNDLFLYMGHGSGGRYFGKSTIRSSDCRAVSVLMGCSSARIMHEGEGFDGQSVIHDYSVARCPCVVGCLWMVTDGEIDRFLMALVKYCFSNSGSSRPAGDDSKEREPPAEARSLTFKEASYRLLIDAVAYARTACRLRYMTGGAVVSYGLPIVARNAPVHSRI